MPKWEKPAEISAEDLAGMEAKLRELHSSGQPTSVDPSRRILPMHRPSSERLLNIYEKWKEEGSPDISLRAVQRGDDLVATEGSHRLFLANALGLPVTTQLMDPEGQVPMDDDQFRWLKSRNVGRDTFGKDLDSLTWAQLAEGIQRARSSDHWKSSDLAYTLPTKVASMDSRKYKRKQAYPLKPGEFTKRANIKALLAALAGAPLIGAASSMYQSGGNRPLESTLGGAPGGLLGGLAGAGTGAAGMALLDMLAKKQINPAMMTSAATLGALLGAYGGGRTAGTSARNLTGASQEELLSAILKEMKGKGVSPYPPADLLR